jgi:hypothetical protein
MNDIIIEYPFWGFKRKARSQVPTSWAELTEQQFLAISEIIDGKERGFDFLKTMTGFKAKLLKRLDPYYILKLAGGIEFIGSADNFHHSFIISKIPGSTLTAPKPKLEGMTFAQFIFCDSWYSDWASRKDETTLNSFIAALYLPDGKNFVNRSVGFSTWKASRTDFTIRKAIALNWSLVMAWLSKAYPLIFREPVEKEPTAGSETTGAKQSPWIKLFETLVGDDLINQDKYADLPVHTVFRHLTEKYKANARKK